jgi:hypothetical protein
MDKLFLKLTLFLFMAIQACLGFKARPDRPLRRSASDRDTKNDKYKNEF